MPRSRSRKSWARGGVPGTLREIPSYIAATFESIGCAVRGWGDGVTQTIVLRVRRIDGTMRNPILDLPLSAVMRSEIALPLQHVLKVYTVGSFLASWRSPKRQREMERLFDSPQQARHAATICAAWLGFETPPTTAQEVAAGWWRKDESAQPALA